MTAVVAIEAQAGPAASPRPSPAPVRPVGAVRSAVDILRCLGASEGRLRLADITRSLGLNGSTTLNILRTLEHEGLVVFDRETKRYGLGHGLVDLARPLQVRHDRARLAEAMAATAHELDATVALWTRRDDEVELVSAAESPAAMRIAFVVGRRLPMFLGAMGRLVAAREPMEAGRRRAEFERAPWRVRPDYDVWLSEVETARRTGYAVDRGHVNPGVLGVAVPVEPKGPLRRIISTVAFSPLEEPGELETIVARLRQLCAICADIP